MRFFIFSFFLGMWLMMWIWIYPCHIKQKCLSEEPGGAATRMSLVSDNAIGFEWSSAQPIKGEDYLLLEDWLRNELRSGSCMELVASFYANESGPADLREIATARALNSWDMLTDGLDALPKIRVQVKDSIEPTESPMGQLLEFRSIRCDVGQNNELTDLLTLDFNEDFRTDIHLHEFRSISNLILYHGSSLQIEAIGRSVPVEAEEDALLAGALLVREELLKLGLTHGQIELIRTVDTSSQEIDLLAGQSAIIKLKETR